MRAALALLLVACSSHPAGPPGWVRTSAPDGTWDAWAPSTLAPPAALPNAPVWQESSTGRFYKVRFEALDQPLADPAAELGRRADERQKGLGPTKYERHAVIVQGEPALDVTWAADQPVQSSACEREIATPTRIYHLEVFGLGPPLPAETCTAFFDQFHLG